MVLRVGKKKVKRDSRKALTGGYIIDTTHRNMDVADILKSYHSINRIEAASRSLKKDLGMCQACQQMAIRTMGNLFIFVLAYYPLSTIELALAGKA